MRDFGTFFILLVVRAQNGSSPVDPSSWRAQRATFEGFWTFRYSESQIFAPSTGVSGLASLELGGTGPTAL